MQRGHWRGYPIIWIGGEFPDKGSWVFEDDKSLIPGYGGDENFRPCVKCGKTFAGSNEGDADPCLGELPGVDNACCGHGVPKDSYIRFTNGVVITGFDKVEYTEKYVKPS